MSGKNQIKYDERFYTLAERYYGTRDLSKLTPYQLDKVTLWVTKRNPDKGRNQDRKAGRSKGRYIKGKL